jgi:hypothetical protein
MVGAASHGLTVGAPAALFDIPWLVPNLGVPAYIYDVMPDGQQFLLIAPTGDRKCADHESTYQLAGRRFWRKELNVPTFGRRTQSLRRH